MLSYLYSVYCFSKSLFLWARFFFPLSWTFDLTGREPSFYVLLCMCFIVKCFQSPVIKRLFKKWSFYCWWIPVSLHLLKTKGSLTFWEKRESTNGLVRGIFLPILWKETCEWAIHLLSIISCSDACTLPGSFDARRKRSAYDIDRHNAWIRLLFHCIKRWSAAFLPFIETECF